MTVRRRRTLRLAVLAAGVLVSAICASSASAVLKKLPTGQIVSYQPVQGASSGITPFDTVFNNMDYNGGPVMPSNTDYMVMWSPQGLSAYPSGFVGGIAQSASDGGTIRLSPAHLQPVASDDVAALVSKVATMAPANGMIELAGPERPPLRISPAGMHEPLRTRLRFAE